MFGKTIATLAVAGGLMVSACGGETVYVTVEPTTTTTETPTTTARPRPPASTPAPSVYDPEAYDEAIWSQANDFWWGFTREQLLNMGLVICQQFDQGRTIDQVAIDLTEIINRNGAQNLADGVASMTAAALLYLCPEHAWWLETI